MTAPRHVVRPDDAGPADPARLGGKGANLVRLHRAGRLVPAFFVVTADAWRDALAGSPETEALGQVLAGIGADASREALAEASAALRRRAARVALPADVDDAIARAFDETFAAGDLAAVRSSAVDEDGRGGSFAGLHESRLFVRDLDGVREAVVAVWASAFLERALRYRLERGIPLDAISMAVVVQAMVEPVASGVCFTAGGAAGDVRTMTIDACWGTGEGLVGEGLDADSFTVVKADRSVAARIAHKTERIVFDRAAGRGVRREAVPEALQDVPCLTSDQLETVIDLGLGIERDHGRPQDIEFCTDADGRVVVLQTRPITTVAEYGPAAGDPILWDNSNIVESYAGVTTPLTFSFIRTAYTVVYRCFLEVMGVPSKVIDAHRAVYENMIGLIRGRVFYNLHNWYRLVGLLPGYRFNKPFMESMMGVRESTEVAVGARPAPGLGGRLGDLLALLRLVARSAWRFAHIQRIADGFQRHVLRTYDGWRELDVDAMSPHELARLYLDLEQRLLWNWKAPIVNDFYVMIFYGVLRRLCTRWCGDEEGSLQNDLLCGEGGLESAEPTRELLRLAADVRRDEAIASWVRDTEPEALARGFLAEGRFPAVGQRLRDHLDRFGFRCVDELKLECPTLRDDPRFLFQVLRNYVRMEDAAALDVEALETRERATRATAEARANRALGRSRGGFLKRWVFRRVLAGARRGVRNRENLRFSRTRVFGMVREIVRAQGRHLVREGLLDRLDDVFYLTVDELWSFVRGTAVTTRLRELAALRRGEFEAYADESDRAPDDRFTTWGMVGHANAYRSGEAGGGAGAEGAEDELHGVACSPGEVRGTVRVVRRPDEAADLDGEILVAERTDPGWVPLYPSVSGILLARGSILSHSAVVAREMGLPVIVGIPGLLTRLRTGQVVSMDGATGCVHVETEPGPPGGEEARS